MAVDASPASEQAVDYVAELGDWASSERYLHMVHVLPPAPEPTEVGEGPHPAEGEEKARALLLGLRQRLFDRGVSAEQVDVGILLLRKDLTIVEGLIDTATARNCGTIIVGRNSLAWYKELFHHHPADELVRKANGFTVWIVE
jgi:hypothetical protein